MEKFANYDCPVCFKEMYLSPRIYQCVNGHIICDSCRLRLTHCPQCRVSFSGKLFRNRLMEEILDGLSYDCPHNENGCLKKLSRQRIKDHGDSCIFGSSFDVCEILAPDSADCHFKLKVGNAGQVLEHFNSVHPQHMNAIGGEMSIRLNLKDRRGREGYVMRPFPDRDCVVLIILTYSRNSVAFSIVDLSLGLSAADNVRAVFSIPDNAPVVSWSIAAVTGIESWKLMKKEGSSPQLNIDKDSLLQCSDGDGLLRIKVQLRSSAREQCEKSPAGMEEELDWRNLTF